MNDKILLAHGSGGKQSAILIENLFRKYFNNPLLNQAGDSTILPEPGTELAFTTDSYVVSPIFFEGGSIGTLAVCGTVNDLAVSGARPIYLSASFIIEEGFLMTELEQIVIDMSGVAKKADITIVTGDTKVVDKGKCDKIFINTAGIGLLPAKYRHISTAGHIAEGDAIIINGTIADHGMAIMAARENLELEPPLASDCAPLNALIAQVLRNNIRVKFMRDVTRGGLATVLVELAQLSGLGINIQEETIPVQTSVSGLCEVLGFDPLYVANEGKILMVVDKHDTDKCLEIMKTFDTGIHSAVIGNTLCGNSQRVTMQTSIGGRRVIDMLSGEQLPRIC